MKTVNESQKNLYKEYDLRGSQKTFERYKPWLENYTSRPCIRILDIGGGSGYFSLRVKSFFAEMGIETQIYVLDSVEYDTWREEKLGSEIRFVCDSAENLGALFPEKTFDIIFANRVVHHMIDRSWRKTLDGMDVFLQAAVKKLEDDGMLCIMEHFYDGWIIDAATSFIIYSITSIENNRIARMVKRLGGESAGVGVCFQSERMWMERLKKAGFGVMKMKRGIYDMLPIAKRIFLMCKTASRNNLICAVPAQTIKQ